MVIVSENLQAKHGIQYIKKYNAVNF
jgi:hypothetical protein